MTLLNCGALWGGGRMGSRAIDELRSERAGASDRDAARALAEKYGYMAIVRYKNSSSASDFTNIGTCTTESEIRGYLTSPYCHAAEIIYDRRVSMFKFGVANVLNGACERCGKKSTRETLQMGAGNDFYFCPQCGLMSCDACYPYLPLTTSPGYGKCPKCDTPVKRAIPSNFVTV